MVRKQKILVGVLAGVGVFLAIVLIVAATFDWNRLKPFIDRKASGALGRPVAINGDLQVDWHREPAETGWRAWVPWPRFTVNDVVIGNTAWGKAPQFATLEQATFTISPLALLSHHVVIRQINLKRPSADLERLKDGRANWTFTRDDKPADESADPSPWILDIREIGFDQGRVGYRDEALQLDLEVGIDPLGKPVPFADIAGKAVADVGGAGAAEEPSGSRADAKARSGRDEGGERSQKAAGGGSTDAGADRKRQAGSAQGDAAKSEPKSEAKKAAGGPERETPDGDAARTNGTTTAARVRAPDYVFGWTVKGSYKGLPVSGKGKTGGMLALQDGAEPFPAQADAAIGRTRVALAGAVINPLKLGGADLRLKLSGQSMADLFPLTGVTLPDTPPYSTDGRLIATLSGEEGSVYEYRGFNGKVGDSDLHGDVRYADVDPRPKLTGKFTSNLLRFADLGPLVGADTGKGSGKRGDTDSEKVAKAERNAQADKRDQPPPRADSPADQPANKALPVQEFRTDRWRVMDGDVTLEARRITQTEGLPISNLRAHVVLTDGKLALTPLRFGVAGGTLDATIHLDGRSKPMPGDVKIAARQLKLKQLFPGVEAMKRSLGELNGDAAIRGRGNSISALLGSANGDAKLLVNDGVISRNLMEIAGLNVGNYVVGRLFGDDEVQINCAASDISLKNGVATPRLFVFDTENMIVDIDGSVDFKSERIDLDITPHSKGLRIVTLRSPLYVKGTLKNPNAGVQVTPLAARAGAAVVLGAVLTPAASLLALIAPSNNEESNQCATMLQQMKRAPQGAMPKTPARGSGK